MKLTTSLAAGAALVCISASGANALPPPIITLWSELAGFNGNAVASDNFGPGSTAYNTDVADDFVVPAGATWHIRQVIARGLYYQGPGPATSVNVFFYSDAGGQPGTLVSQCLNLVGGGFATGNFNVQLTACTPVVPDFPGGASGTTYWVEVQANMPAFSNGIWGWDNRNGQPGYGPEFQNPGGGFGTCNVWMPETICVGSGRDHRFRLRGFL